MPDDPKFSFREFGASFKTFLDQVSAQAPAAEAPFLQRLRGHFGVEAAKLPIVAESFPAADHPNVQVALDAHLAAPGRSAAVTGISVAHEFGRVSLSHLVVDAGGMFGGQPPQEGPVEYVNIALDEGRVLPCVQRGVFFIAEADERLVALVSGPSQMTWRSEVRVEVMASERARAERFLGELRSIARSRNVYRGHVVSLERDQMQALHVKFHRLPEIARTGIVLPDGLLDRIERGTVRFAAQRERLKHAGRHLKRGILFHGPPGTGKTLTAMYLAGQMRDRTVLLLTGRALGLTEASCAMARTLEPSMLIVEDVDLIAEERDRQTPGCTALLFELLNQMDGLADDADVLSCSPPTARTYSSRPWPRVPGAWTRPSSSRCRTRRGGDGSSHCTARGSPWSSRTSMRSSIAPRTSARRSSASCSARPPCSPPRTGTPWSSATGTWTMRSTISSCTAAI